MNCIVMKAPAIHYILKDHLGSWTTITDANGTVEQELSFDAWGNLRNPDTWTGYTVPEPVVAEPCRSVEGPMFDRGFTGHEHMTAFGLINMESKPAKKIPNSIRDFRCAVAQLGLEPRFKV